MSLDIDLVVYVDTGSEEPYRVELYSANITHNLNKMAEAAGIYKVLWRPDELWGEPTADKMIPHLESGLHKLKSNADYFSLYNSPNGYGMYEHFVPFVEEVLNACKEHPKSKVEVSR